MEEFLNSPIMRLALVSMISAAIVSALSWVGRVQSKVIEGKIHYKRRSGILGVFWIGKNQWLWTIPLNVAAFYLGEIPTEYGLFVTVGMLSILSVGWHSMAKNAGKESVVEWIGSVFAKKIEGKVGE